MAYQVNPPGTEALRLLAMQGLGVAVGEEAKQQLETLAIGKVEVEIQNGYLQETCTRLRLALHEFTDLYDFAPVACFSTDANGKISRLNLSGARLLGGERNALLGKTFVDFFPRQQRKRIGSLMHQASLLGEDQQCILPLSGGEGGAQQYVQLSVSSLVRGHGHSLALVPVAHHPIYEDELQELRGIQQAIFDSLPQYLAVLDGEGRVLRTNALWNALGLTLGHAYRNGWVHAGYADLLDAVTVAGDDRCAALAGLADVLEGKVPSFQLAYAFGKGDQRRWFLMHAMAVHNARARAVVSHQEITPFRG